MNNKTMIQYFEWYLPCDKTLWRKVKKEAGYLSNLGITSVWQIGRASCRERV